MLFRSRAQRGTAAALGGLPRTDPGGRPVRVVLLGRRGCHLCEVARQTVQETCQRSGVGWVERDVDASPELRSAYATKVPVVLVDGREHATWHVDAEGLATALK